MADAAPAATAVLVPRAACHALWDFLLSGERKALIASCKESDSWCLRNIRDHRLEPKRRRGLDHDSGEPPAVPAGVQEIVAPATPDPLRGLLEVLERKLDRLANDLIRTRAFFENRQRLLDSRLAQISVQLDALRDHVFVGPAAVRVEPDVHDVFDLNCPQHVAEQAIQDPSTLLRAVRYHESRLDSVVALLDDVQAAVRQR